MASIKKEIERNVPDIGLVDISFSETYSSQFFRDDLGRASLAHEDWDAEAIASHGALMVKRQHQDASGGDYVVVELLPHTVSRVSVGNTPRVKRKDGTRLSTQDCSDVMSMILSKCQEYGLKNVRCSACLIDGATWGYLVVTAPRNDAPRNNCWRFPTKTSQSPLFLHGAYAVCTPTFDDNGGLPDDGNNSPIFQEEIPLDLSFVDDFGDGVSPNNKQMWG